MSVRGNVEKMSIREKAYELYKLDWLASHKYTLDDVLKKAFAIMQSNVLDIQVEDDLLDAFEEVGLNGEIYVCFNEFIEYEYQDNAYMEWLLVGKINAIERTQERKNEQEKICVEFKTRKTNRTYGVLT